MPGSEHLMVPVRFGVNTRTNSVIASGTSADMAVIEAVLTKLDEARCGGRRAR